LEYGSLALTLDPGVIPAGANRNDLTVVVTHMTSEWVFRRADWKAAPEYASGCRVVISSLGRSSTEREPSTEEMEESAAGRE
jgi:hypothetical protein